MKYIKWILIFSFISYSSADSSYKEELPHLDQINFTASFKEKVVDHLYLSLDQWSQSASFKGEKGLKIHYRIYGKKQAHTKPLIIVPGFAESSLKYLEVAYDLIQNSFSPIYVIDHRNQGASDRALEQDKGYIEDFSFYSKDLQYFINNIVKVEHPHQKPYLLAHSMGGIISLFYLKNNPEVIDSAVLSSPLIRIKVFRLVEWFVSGLSFVYFSLFDKGSLSIKQRKISIEFNSKNKVTHDRDRFQFNRWIDLSEGYYIKKVTLRWTQETMKNSRHLIEETHKIKTKLLILTAEKETIVDNKAAQKICKKITSCSLIPIKKGKHELLMEQNEVRETTLNNILSFFNQSNPSSK